MHEYSIVEDLIRQLSNRLQTEGITQVKQIRLRRDSTFSRAALEQACQVLSPHTPFQNAEWVIEDREVSNTCARCGFVETVHADDLLGHHYVCPQCGQSVLIDEHHGLELLGMEADGRSEEEK